MIYKRRKLIKLLKRDNTMLDTGKKGAERALKDLNELSFYESKTNLPLTMPVKINKLCDHLTNVAQNHCSKNVITVFQTDFSDDFEIKTNAEALEKLLSHLLNSSASFTSKGTILLKCAENGEFIMFSIVDTSKVFADSTKGMLSDMFAEDENTARFISMNFSICQSISCLLHGRLWHDDKYTAGTRFCFEIPKNNVTDIHNTITDTPHY